jgi:hypothetical protein
MDAQRDDSGICQRCSKTMMYDADGRYYCHCENEDDNSDWFDEELDDTPLHPFWEGLIANDSI